MPKLRNKDIFTNGVKTHKHCSKCDQTKLISDFGNNRQNKDKKDYRCKICANFVAREHRKSNKEEYKRKDLARYYKNHDNKKAIGRKHYHKNKDVIVDRTMKRRYGISNEFYKNRCLELNNKCEICFQFVEVPNIDHCHSSGKYRGLLCHFCNIGIGSFRDSDSYLLSAANYIKRFNSNE